MNVCMDCERNGIRMKFCTEKSNKVSRDACSSPDNVCTNINSRMHTYIHKDINSGFNSVAFIAICWPFTYIKMFWNNACSGSLPFRHTLFKWHVNLKYSMV